MKKFKNAVETTNFKNLQNLEEEGKFSENVYSNMIKGKLNFFIKDQIMIGKKI